MLGFRAVVVLTAVAVCVVACSRQQRTTAAQAPPAYSDRPGVTQGVAISPPTASEHQSPPKPVPLSATSTPLVVNPGPSAHTAPTTIQATSETAALSDDAIRAAIIQQSLASYYGSCPCPYSTDRGGRRCGGRSAYSKPGGASPHCYSSDVSDEMVSAFRANRAADAKQAPTRVWPCAENGSCYGDVSPSTGRPKTVPVSGYYRKDGTYVRGYYRSRPSY